MNILYALAEGRRRGSDGAGAVFTECLGKIDDHNTIISAKSPYACYAFNMAGTFAPPGSYYLSGALPCDIVLAGDGGYLFSRRPSLIWGEYRGGRSPPIGS